LGPRLCCVLVPLPSSPCLPPPRRGGGLLRRHRGGEAAAGEVRRCPGWGVGGSAVGGRLGAVLSCRSSWWLVGRGAVPPSVGRSACRLVLAWAVVVRRPGGGGCLPPRWWWWLGWLFVSPVGGRGSGCGLGLLILCRRRPLCSVVRSAVGCLIVACRWHRLDGVVLSGIGWLVDRSCRAGIVLGLFEVD